MPRTVVRRNRAWGLLPSKGSFTLSPATRAFACDEGATSLAPQTVAIAIAGTQGVGTITAGTPSAAWLTVTVQGSLAEGYSLLVQADPSGLTAATRQATCVISASNADPATLTVDFTVRAATLPAAIIQPAHTSVDFKAAAGATATTPTSEVVTISNIGSDAFAGLVATPSAAYVEATVTGSTVTIRPNGAGLAALAPNQNHWSTVTLTDAHAAAAAVLNVLVVIGAVVTQPLLNVTPGSMSLAGTVGDGVTHSGAALISDGNGTGQLTAPTAGAITYGPGASGWLAVSVTGSAAPFTLSCVATTGARAAGTYTASFTLSGGGATNSVPFSVTFVVGAVTPGLYDAPRWTLPTWATFNTADDDVEGAPMALPALGSFG